MICYMCMNVSMHIIQLSYDIQYTNTTTMGVTNIPIVIYNVDNYLIYLNICIQDIRLLYAGCNEYPDWLRV